MAAGTEALVSDPCDAALSAVAPVEAVREGGLAQLGPAPYVLEIGFGRGEILLAAARERPDTTFLGLEVSRKRVAKMARRVERAELRNVRLLHAPAEYVLERVLPGAVLSECWVHCPDPWPKKRHHRRRLIQAPAVRELARVLQPGAPLHVSTDHEGYAEWIDAVLAAEPGLRNLHAPAPWATEPPARPRTAYEQEWIAEGRRIAYFAYARVAPETGAA